MGSSSSRTRKLTLENEDATSVIKVSDDVVNRLRGSEKVVRDSVNSGAQWPAIPGSIPPGVSPHPYFMEPSLTSIQFRQEKEKALQENDKYWEKRVNDLQKMHGEMHDVMEVEFQKARKEMGIEIENKNPCTKPPCQKAKKAVLECYKKNPKEPMKCNKEVEAFAECVDLQRAILISNRG